MRKSDTFLDRKHIASKVLFLLRDYVTPKIIDKFMRTNMTIFVMFLSGEMRTRLNSGHHLNNQNVST